MLDLLILVSACVASGGAGYLLAVWRRPLVQLPDEPQPLILGSHPHVYTTMKKDGLWRCVCGKKAPDEKQPRMKAGA